MQWKLWNVEFEISVSHFPASVLVKYDLLGQIYCVQRTIILDINGRAFSQFVTLPYF